MKATESLVEKRFTASPVRALVVVAAAISVLAVVACRPLGDNTDDSSSDLDTAALVCQAPPVARSYVLFDGEKLEQKRANEAVDAIRLRFKPFAVMSDEYQRVLGVVPQSLADAAETFEDAPARWFSEAQPSGVSLSAIYDIGLDGCMASVAAADDKATAPTADTAAAFCKDLIAKAWGTDPADDELAACVDLATNKLANEGDPRLRWAHTCASILTSSQFLTY